MADTAKKVARKPIENPLAGLTSGQRVVFFARKAASAFARVDIMLSEDDTLGKAASKILESMDALIMACEKLPKDWTAARVRRENLIEVGSLVCVKDSRLDDFQGLIDTKLIEGKWAVKAMTEKHCACLSSVDGKTLQAFPRANLKLAK